MVQQTGSEFKARVLGAEFQAQTLRSFGLMRAYVTRTGMPLKPYPGAQGPDSYCRPLGAESWAVVCRTCSYGPLIANFFQQTGTTRGGIQAVSLQ
jgi:hypothetical protein